MSPLIISIYMVTMATTSPRQPISLDNKSLCLFYLNEQKKNKKKFKNQRNAQNHHKMRVFGCCHGNE